MREVIMRLTTKPFEAATYAEIVQELVRCWNCKHYIKHDKRCDVWNHGVLSCGFCYRGEEKEG